MSQSSLSKLLRPYKLMFLVGETYTRDLRTQFANELSDIDGGTIVRSFEEPLRNAMNGLFFGCDPSIDCRRDDLTLPISSYEKEDACAFRLGLHAFLERRYGMDILGKLLLPKAQEDLESFDLVVIDDAGGDLLKDMTFIREAINPSLTITFGDHNVISPPLTWPDPVILLPLGSVDVLFAKMEEILLSLSISDPTSSPTGA